MNFIKTLFIKNQHNQTNSLLSCADYCCVRASWEILDGLIVNITDRRLLINILLKGIRYNSLLNAYLPLSLILRHYIFLTLIAFHRFQLVQRVRDHEREGKDDSYSKLADNTYEWLNQPNLFTISLQVQIKKHTHARYCTHLCRQIYFEWVDYAQKCPNGSNENAKSDP